jgi:methionyl-tRNA formyltransferase
MLMPELHDKMAKQGADMLVDCIKDLPRYYENCWSQTNLEATYGEYIERTF